MGQHTALEIGPQLAFDESRYGRTVLSRIREERLELLADDFMEKGLFGFVAFVLDGSNQSNGTMKWGAALHDTRKQAARRGNRDAKLAAERGRTPG